MYARVRRRNLLSGQLGLLPTPGSSGDDFPPYDPGPTDPPVYVPPSDPPGPILPPPPLPPPPVITTGPIAPYYGPADSPPNPAPGVDPPPDVDPPPMYPHDYAVPNCVPGEELIFVGGDVGYVCRQITDPPVYVPPTNTGGIKPITPPYIRPPYDCIQANGCYPDTTPLPPTPGTRDPINGGIRYLGPPIKLRPRTTGVTAKVDPAANPISLTPPATAATTTPATTPAAGIFGLPAKILGFDTPVVLLVGGLGGLILFSMMSGGTKTK